MHSFHTALPSNVRCRPFSLLAGLPFPACIWALCPGYRLGLLWFPELERLSPFLGLGGVRTGGGVPTGASGSWEDGKGHQGSFKSSPLLMESRTQNSQDATVSHGGCHVGSCTGWGTQVTWFNPQHPPPHTR